MAKSRLTPDYIEWVMSLNANQALRAIHKVNLRFFVFLGIWILAGGKDVVTLHVKPEDKGFHGKEKHD
jgi:hypothetical protein